MAVFANIENALNTRLSTLASLPPTEWPNTEYTSVENTTWLRPTVLPAYTTLNTIGGSQLHRGIYQVDIFVPLEKGIDTLTTWMDNIFNHFKGDLDLVAGSDTILLQEIGITSVQRVDAWFMGSITINYKCYS